MTDYQGFAALGDVLAGGAGRRAEREYPTRLKQNFDAFDALNQARISRAQMLARESLPEAVRTSGIDNPDLATAILGMATGQPNFGTLTEGMKDLGDIALDKQALEALQRNDMQAARNYSAVKTDKILPTLGAGGSAVFTPVTGEVDLTPLGDATVRQRDAAASASLVRAQAAAAASRSRAGLYDVQAAAGGWKPSTGGTRNPAAANYSIPTLSQAGEDPAQLDKLIQWQAQQAEIDPAYRDADYAVAMWKSNKPATQVVELSGKRVEMPADIPVGFVQVLMQANRDRGRAGLPPLTRDEQIAMVNQQVATGTAQDVGAAGLGLLQQAREAIGRGAKPEAVRARLLKLGRSDLAAKL
jgi:hypothetical protein